ncbi:MAG: SHOCT domain-containing protein [Acidimicrobiales bacterium]
MAFPTKLLNEGEEVVLDLNPHWSTLVKPLALLVVVLAATIAGASLSSVLGYGLAVALLVTAVWASLKVARRQTTEFVVTTARLIYRSGLVAKHGKEIPLERVNDISFNQSVFERLIGTGDLAIESAGAQSRETFTDIPKPSQVQNEIYRLMDAASGHHTERRELSLGEQLQQLDELRQRGVLTDAEFDAKKQQLLDRF